MAKSRYEELLNMAHSATNGAGAAFSRDEQGNTYVDTYTGNGQERQQVAFTPDKPVEERHSKYEELLNMAYHATGGEGAAFSRDEQGNVYVTPWEATKKRTEETQAAKTGGVYKQEDMSTVDKAVDSLLGVDRTQVTGEKTNWWQLLKGTVSKGLNQWNSLNWKSVDFLFGDLAEDLHALGTETVNGVIEALNYIPGVNLKYIGQDSKNLVEWGNEDAQAGLQQATEKYAANANSSRAAQIVDKFGTSTVAAVPMALEAILLAPAQAAQAGAATTAGLQYFSGLQSAAGMEAAGMMAKQGLTKLVQNPQFWTSYLQVAGDGYESALEDGMSEEDAGLYGLVNGFFNAMVEIGGADEALGGIQNLPMRLQQQGGKHAVVEWFKEAVLGEASEEVIQGLTERGLLQGMQGDSIGEMFSLDPANTRAAFNPWTAAQEAIGGGVVGAVLGGGQTAINKAVTGGMNAAADAITTRQEQREQAAKETGRQYVQQVITNMDVSEAEQQVLTDGLQTGNADPQTYAQGIQEAFRLGEMGLSYEQAVDNSTLGDQLNEAQFRHAWEIGARKGGHSTEAQNLSSTRPVNVPEYESIEEFSRDFKSPERVTEIFDSVPETDVNEFAAGFRAAYDMGQSGVSANYLTEANVPTLTTEQAQAAYQLGRQDAETLAVDRDLRTAQRQRTGGNQARMRGSVRGDGVSIADLKRTFNDSQNTAYRLLTRYADTTGVNIVLYNSQADANGIFPAAQGRFQWKDDTIYVDINSGLFSTNDVNGLGNYTMMRTFAHEFTHFIEKWNSSQYNEFREFVFQTMEARGQNVHDMIEAKQALDESGNMTYEQASREVVADAMMDILPDSSLVQQLANEHPNVFRTLLRKLREFAARMKQYYRGLTGRITEAETLKENGAYLDDIVQMWDNIAKGAVRNYQGANGEILVDQPAKPENLPRRTSRVQENSKSNPSPAQPETRRAGMDFFRPVETTEEAAPNLRQMAAQRNRPASMDFFREVEVNEEEAPNLAQMAAQRNQPVTRDRFPANDFTSQAEAAPDLKGMVPRAQEAPSEAQETQAAEEEPETPAAAETPAAEETGASEARQDTPEGARLRARLEAGNGPVIMNGFEYAVTGWNNTTIDLANNKTGNNVTYTATIRRVDTSGPVPIFDGHRLFDGKFQFKEDAIEALVTIAEESNLLKEAPTRKGSADTFAKGDIFTKGAAEKVAESKPARDIVEKMPNAEEQKPEKAPKTRFPLHQWKKGTPSQKAAYRILLDYLRQGKGLPSKDLYAICDEAFGGTQAEGNYNRKDAYDAMELAVNQYITETMKSYNDGDAETAKRGVEFAQRLLSMLPTQNVRTQEQLDYQQFSTPPSIAFLAAWAANINNQDHVLEPSAGIGGLLSFAKAWGAETTANELSERRYAIIQAMGFDHYFNENAEHIDDILPDDIQPTVVIMNPPFSSTAGRTKSNKTSNAELHINSALDRLADGGRLVAIVGRGMAEDKYSKYWNKVRQEYTIRANIGIDGSNYTKYGTSFDVQIVVIDKVGPQGNAKTITGSYKSLSEVPEVLEGIRNDRSTEVERNAAVERDTEHDRAERGEEQPVRAPMAQADTSDSRRAESGNRTDTGRSGKSGSTDVQRTERGAEPVPDAGASKRGAVEQQRSDKKGPAGTETAAKGEELRSDTGTDRTASDVQRQSEQPRRGSESEPSRNGQVSADPVTDDGVYTGYRAPEIPIKGSKPHPAVLVESAAMGAVDMPKATYKPQLPDSITKTGALSTEQLVSVTYAGQAHEQKLPNGERRGFFIGDGTGVGKGRTISGIIFDNFEQGRKKAIWISENTKLLPDAIRDWTDISGRGKDDIKDLSTVKLGSKIEKPEGIVFTSYDTVRTKKGNLSRIDQLVDWFGKDFDGVIAFDEAHNMGNLLGKSGSRGKTSGSGKAIAAVELQKRLPNARVVYVSATAATEVSGLAFASRLGLWGKGTAFTDVNDFVSKIGSAGLSAMELVVRDMKSMGMYVARSISYNGVEYDTVQHDLDPIQRQIYNTMSRAWQNTMRSVEQSLVDTGAQHNSQAKQNAIGQYFSAIQRFYNQVLTSMSMPSVIVDMKKQLAAGRSCVLQIVNTNQAAADRQIADIKANGGELEDMDLTPRGTLIDYLMKCYPVTKFEEYEDEDGNVRSRPVTNSKGEPVIDKKAVAKRDALIAEVNQMSIPDGPLEMLFDAFGTENVSEITGRTRRVVPRKQEDGTIKRVEEPRTKSSRQADISAFQNGDKRILVFSAAGGTGASYHADLRAKNQQQRVHYVLQPGWEASKAVQGFGRTHRSNEASAPIYKLVTTDIKGQKRFTSTIARRLDQLGALTKGQRDTGSGMFGASDNLETDLARDSLREFYRRLGTDKLEGINGKEVLQKLGLLEKFTGEYGQFKLDETVSRDISKFLNRILALEVDEQNRVFDAFISIYEAEMDAAIQAGTLDRGMENVKADKIEIVDDKVIHEQEGTGAATHYVQAKVYTKPKVITTVAEAENFKSGFEGIFRTKDGDIRAVYRIADKTTEYGAIVKQYKIQSPNRSKSSVWQERTLNANAELLPKAEWQKAWDEELKKVPEYNEEVKHLLSGSLLPIWNSLPEEGNTKVQRLITDDGKAYLGRIIPADKIDGVLSRFGENRTKEKFTGKSLMQKALKSNATFNLTFYRAKIHRSRVSGEWRLEYEQPQNAWAIQQQYPDMIMERISYTNRFFIPTNEKGEALLDKLLENNPVANVVERGEDIVQYSRRQQREERAESADVQESTRQRTISNREVLSMAAEELDSESLNEAERNALQIFRDNLTRLEEEQDNRQRLGREYKDQQFTKGGSRQEADRIRAAMSVSDSKIKALENRLLSLENKEVLKGVLEKARRVVELEERKRGDENLKRYRERRNESMATRKYRERVRREVETLREWLMRPSNKDQRAHVPAEIQKTVADFIESINFMSKTALRTSGLETTKADERYLKNLRKMRDAIKANVDTQGYSGYADLPEGFVDTFNALITKAEQHISDSSGVFVVNQMSAAELQQLAQTIRTLRKYIVTMNSFHNNAMFQHAYEAGEDTVQHLSKFQKSKKSGTAYKFMRFDYMRPSYAFEHFGKGGQSIEHEFREGQATQAFLANRIIDFAKKTYTGKEVEKWSKETKTFTTTDGETVTMPITHLMSLYCLNKRPQALTHIYGDGIRVANYKNGKQVELDEGHIVTIEDVQQMIQELTPRQREVADALQKYMSTETATWGNYVSLARFDVEQFTEENYFPINSDGRYLSTTADESPDNAGLYALLNSSFTKELKENADNRIILYNIFDVFANHTASMTQYRSFALPVLDALKWFNYKNDTTSVRTKLSSAFGAPLDERAGSGAKGYAEQFVINLLKAYNGTSAQGDPYDSLPLKMLHHFNGAAIAYNLRVVIQQPTAITRAAMILSPAKLMKGLSMSAVQMRKLADEMEQHSGIAAWKALGFYDTNISRGLTDLIKQNPGVLDQVMEVGTKGAEAADRFTWAAMWYAAKDTVKRSDYRTEEEYFKAVTDLFEETIYKTQVVDSLLTKAEFLRSKGGIARQLGSFMSEPSATMSMLTDAYFKYTDDLQQGMSRSEAWKKNGGNIAKTAAVYAIGQVILSAMQAVIDAWRDQDDKDPDWLKNYLQKYLAAFKSNVVEEELIFGKIPAVSELYDLMKNYLDKFGVFDKLGLDIYGNDLSSGLAMYTKYLTKAMDIIAGKVTGDSKYNNYTPYSVIYNLVRAASNLSGIPLATAWREVQDLWNNTVGFFNPRMKLVTYQRTIDKKYNDFIAPTGLAKATFEKILDDADQVHGDSNGKYKQDEVGAALVAALEDGTITEEQAAAIWKTQWSKENNKTFDEWRSGGKKSDSAETPAASTAGTSTASKRVAFTPTAAPAATSAPAATGARSYDDFKKVPVYDSTAKQAMYGIWETQLQSSMSLDRFMEILTTADTDGNDSLKQDEMGVALMTSLQSGELTFDQCDAIWRTQWNKARSKTFAKWLNG